MRQTQYDFKANFLLKSTNGPSLSCQLPSIRLALPEFFPPQPSCILSNTSCIFLTSSRKTFKKTRLRRRYDEVRRYYRCVFPACSKAYGALNHLNSHIVDKNHGPKRQPEEFKQLRQQLKQEKQLISHNVSYQSTPITTDSFVQVFLP